jgi:hypothetical protein
MEIDISSVYPDEQRTRVANEKNDTQMRQTTNPPAKCSPHFLSKPGNPLPDPTHYHSLPNRLSWKCQANNRPKFEGINRTFLHFPCLHSSLLYLQGRKRRNIQNCAMPTGRWHLRWAPGGRDRLVGVEGIGFSWQWRTWLLTH